MGIAIPIEPSDIFPETDHSAEALEATPTPTVPALLAAPEAAPAGAAAQAATPPAELDAMALSLVEVRDPGSAKGLLTTNVVPTPFVSTNVRTNTSPRDRQPMTAPANLPKPRYLDPFGSLMFS